MTSSLRTCSSLINMRIAAALVGTASVVISSALSPGLDTNSSMKIASIGTVDKIPETVDERGMDGSCMNFISSPSALLAIIVLTYSSTLPPRPLAYVLSLMGVLSNAKCRSIARPGEFSKLPAEFIVHKHVHARSIPIDGPTANGVNGHRMCVAAIPTSWYTY